MVNASLGVSESSHNNPPRRRPPYLSKSSNAYRFALLVWEGDDFQTAARKIEVPEETARKWRAGLRRQASAFAGREVTYLYALRLIFEPERVAAESAQLAR